MTTIIKPLLVASLLAASSVGAIASEAPTVGSTILGVKVDVRGIVTTGFRASQLIGTVVVDEANKEVGAVHDLILSNTGKVNIAILEVGGFIGIGAKYVAVPAHLFTDVSAKRVTLPGITEQKLKDMPAFHYAS